MAVISLLSLPCPQAYERRFPTCPLIPMFVDSDTVSEFKSEDGAIHVIERRCKLDIDAPRLLKKVSGGGHFRRLQAPNRQGEGRQSWSLQSTVNKCFPSSSLLKDCRSRLCLFCSEKLTEFSGTHFAHRGPQ